jgi:hypothetical protein
MDLLLRSVKFGGYIFTFDYEKDVSAACGGDGPTRLLGERGTVSPVG